MSNQISGEAEGATQAERTRQGESGRQAQLMALSRGSRLFQIASDKMDDAFSRIVGINLTDGRCIDLLDVLGGMTAGELAQAASLSPGAVTTVLDRLERMDLVTRTRDETDRRRVIVELTPKARELAWSIYGPIAGYASEYLEGLSDDELAVINRFLEVATEINERRAAEVSAGEA
jgi:DNA-binding MarR family transcriptional regulator